MHALITASRLISLLVLTFGLGTGLTLMPKLSHSFAGTLPAFAREEEDEEDEREQDHEDEEDEYEEDDEDEYRSRTVSPSATESVKTEKTPRSKTVVQEIVEKQPVTETYVETEPGYATDDDADGLVDALDPDPAVPQTAYFTDDDGDSVPNALDTRPGVDDILALDELNDSNANGILDAYESL